MDLGKIVAVCALMLLCNVLIVVAIQFSERREQARLSRLRLRWLPPGSPNWTR
jgi:hypothetical protein